MKGGLLELCGHLRWLNPHKLRLLCPLQFSLWTYFCVERWRKSTGFNYAHFKSNFTDLIIATVHPRPVLCVSLRAAPYFSLLTLHVMFCSVALKYQFSGSKRCRPKLKTFGAESEGGLQDWPRALALHLTAVFSVDMNSNNKQKVSYIEVGGRDPLYPTVITCMHKKIAGLSLTN